MGLTPMMRSPPTLFANEATQARNSNLSSLFLNSTRPDYSLRLMRQPVELFGGCLILADSVSAWAPTYSSAIEHRQSDLRDLTQCPAV